MLLVSCSLSPLASAESSRARSPTVAFSRACCVLPSLRLSSRSPSAPPLNAWRPSHLSTHPLSNSTRTPPPPALRLKTSTTRRRATAAVRTGAAPLALVPRRRRPRTDRRSHSSSGCAKCQTLCPRCSRRAKLQQADTQAETRRRRQLRQRRHRPQARTSRKRDVVFGSVSGPSIRCRRSSAKGRTAWYARRFIGHLASESRSRRLHPSTTRVRLVLRT